MGRTKYTEEERDQILISFIRAAREILDAEGIEKISIRKIASLTGLNSATMYLYFPNADVLITMASMSYLEKYCRTLAADMPLMSTNRDAFFHSWEVFSRFAFEQPKIFFHIFYEPHAVSLNEIVDEYYRLFPKQLSDIEGNVYEMLRSGTLAERCWTILQPLASELGISDRDARILNDMSIYYFRGLLEERCRDSEGLVKSEQLTNKLHQALELLIGRAQAAQPK